MPEIPSRAELNQELSDQAPDPSSLPDLQAQADQLDPRSKGAEEALADAPSTDDVLAEIFGEQKAEEAAPVAPPAKEPAAEVAPPEPAKKEPEKGPDWQMLMQREAAVIAREAQLAAKQEEIEGLSKRLDSYESQQRKFKLDPISYIRSIAPDADLDFIGRAAWYAAHPDKAPPDWQTKLESRATRYELEQFREEQAKQHEAKSKRDEQPSEDEDLRKQQEQAVNTYREHLGEYLSQGDISKYQRVQALANKSAGKATSMAFETAREVATRLNRVPTADEVYQALEDELNELYGTPAPKAEPERKPATDTLRNQHTAVQPSRQTPDPDDPAVLRRAALEAAGLDPDDPAIGRYFQ